MDKSAKVISCADLYCDKAGHDKVYRLVLIKTEIENDPYPFCVWSFYKARTANKWNSKELDVFANEYSANMFFAKTYRSKLAKGYVDTASKPFTSAVPYPFMSDDRMLAIAGFDVSVPNYECIDDFAEKAGFIVGCEYIPSEVKETTICLCNDAGEMKELPLDYFRKVG